MSNQNQSKSDINVTPLIDILLVLLIIFMVVSPIKPSRFLANIPQENNKPGDPNPLSIVVTVRPDLTLSLNQEENLGTINEPSPLLTKLSTIFAERTRNGVLADAMSGRNDLEWEQRIQKTVFLKAPRTISYGEIAKVVDGLKGAGANPIGLQIDGLE
jgi:biopolymer transport protein ExbD